MQVEDLVFAPTPADILNKKIIGLSHRTDYVVFRLEDDSIICLESHAEVEFNGRVSYSYVGPDILAQPINHPIDVQDLHNLGFFDSEELSRRDDQQIGAVDDYGQ